MERLPEGMNRHEWQIEPAMSSHKAELGSSGVAPIVNNTNAYSIAPHIHDCDMIFIPLSGRFIFEQNITPPLLVRPGYFLWVPAAHAHATYSYSSRQSHLTLYINSDFGKEALNANGVKSAHPGLRAASSALSYYSRELALYRRDNTKYAMTARCGALMQEAARLSAATPLLAGPVSTADYAFLLADQIDRELCEPLDVEAFARQQRISRRQIERMFQEHFKMGPLAYQQQQRLKRALYLLKETSFSVNSIAQQVGWSSGSYLAKLLSKAYGITASELRPR